MEAAVPEVATQSWGLIIVQFTAYSIWIAVALLTGRAIALAWRPWWHVVVAILLVACAVRFLRFALFADTLLHWQHFVVDAAGLFVVGIAGFRATRVAQMVGNYGWVNERSGPFRWRRRAVNSSKSG